MQWRTEAARVVAVLAVVVAAAAVDMCALVRVALADIGLVAEAPAPLVAPEGARRLCGW